MNVPPATGTPAAAPPATTPAAPGAVAAVPAPSGVWAAVAGLAIIPILFFIAFHVGAGYLSYQKYGNIGWAFVNFIFAYFYYPYYAFFLAKEAPPSMMPAIIGGKRGGVFKALGKLLK
jgi:energy-coupling factor transporter transmembrane protein EcfT